MMTTGFKQEHMPVTQLAEPGRYHMTGEHAGCDYCATDAIWFHFADPRNVNRDAFACNDHVGLLNRYYG